MTAPAPKPAPITRGCVCKGKNRCDWCWDRIFEKKHGAAARKYYEDPAPPLRGMSLTNWASDLSGISRKDLRRSRATLVLPTND